MQRGMRPAVADHPDAAINTFVTARPNVSFVCDTFTDPQNHTAENGHQGMPKDRTQILHIKFTQSITSLEYFLIFVMKHAYLKRAYNPLTLYLNTM